jgi:asparagine synthase (glutamine-hydrolysing)
VEDTHYFGMDLNAALARSVMVEPLPLYLRIEDRNSMAHSIEVRVPFLDHRLVSMAFGLPAEWRMRGPWNKFLLRQGMRNRIPESVRTRIKKFGFNVPVKKWFAGELYGPVHDLLSSRPARERGIYDINVVIRDLERHRKGEIDVGFQLFRISQFECWSEMLNQK